MNTLTVKIPAQLERELRLLSAREHRPRSEVVRQAIQEYISSRAPTLAPASALELAGDLVGCFTGGPADLASNPRHLDGFGQV